MSDDDDDCWGWIVWTFCFDNKRDFEVSQRSKYSEWMTQFKNLTVAKRGVFNVQLREKKRTPYVILDDITFPGVQCESDDCHGYVAPFPDSGKFSTKYIEGKKQFELFNETGDRVGTLTYGFRGY